MGWYTVDVVCPSCGEVHRLWCGLRIDRGPMAEGPAAVLYPRGLPRALLRALKDYLMWCDGAGQYVTPRPEAGVSAAYTPRVSGRLGYDDGSHAE